MDTLRDEIIDHQTISPNELGIWRMDLCLEWRTDILPFREDEHNHIHIAIQLKEKQRRPHIETTFKHQFGQFLNPTHRYVITYPDPSYPEYALQYISKDEYYGTQKGYPIKTWYDPTYKTEQDNFTWALNELIRPIPLSRWEKPNQDRYYYQQPKLNNPAERIMYAQILLQRYKRDSKKYGGKVVFYDEMYNELEKTEYMHPYIQNLRKEIGYLVAHHNSNLSE
jgi:hypothetical protein